MFTIGRVKFDNLSEYIEYSQLYYIYSFTLRIGLILQKYKTVLLWDEIVNKVSLFSKFWNSINTGFINLIKNYCYDDYFDYSKFKLARHLK